jgi:hypothetical protein
MARGVFVVQAAPAVPERTDEFNDWYDDTHVPQLLTLPGFVRARRFRAVNPPPDGPYEEYLAIYEFDVEDVEDVAGVVWDASTSGVLTESDVLRWDPPPRVQVFEEIFDSDPPA